MNLRKIFNSLNIHSTSDNDVDRPSSSLARVKIKGASSGINGAHHQESRIMDPDDLLAQHMAQRAQRMFEAEAAAARKSVERRARRLSETNLVPYAYHDSTLDSTYRQNTFSHSSTHLNRGDDDGAERQRHRHHRRHRDPLARMTRRDRNVRAAALATISATMLDTTLSPHSAALTLRKVMEECRSAGVTFGELLEEKVEGLDITPLVMELIRCDWEKGPELVLFLLEHSLSKRLLWSVRRGCMFRHDNLYQTLRHLLPHQEDIQPWDPPPFEFEVSIQQQASLADYPSTQHNAQPPNEFRALISIPNFPTALSNDAKALAKRRTIPPEKLGESSSTPLRPEAGLVVDWIACGRVWTMEIGHNHLILSLEDGEACSVEARMVIVKEDRPTLKLQIADGISPSNPQNGSNAQHIPVVNLNPATPISHDPSKPRPLPIPGAVAAVVSLRPVMSVNSRPARPPRPPRVLTFPTCTLHPLYSRGPHKVTIAPCFPYVSSSSTTPSSSFTKTVLSSQELLVELVVKIGKPTNDDSKEAIMARRPASIGGRSMVLSTEDGDPFFDNASSYEDQSGFSHLVAHDHGSAGPYMTVYDGSIAGHTSAEHLLGSEAHDMISRSSSPQFTNPLQHVDFGPYGPVDENGAGPSQWNNGFSNAGFASARRSSSC
ncbi:hypothetical protein FRC02_008364 [Tulasnella sp. 418]|nr:hypothetical protein FRC02_008364 [Tulasnella sp. 418]